MGDRTGIEWTDATWNPVTGCTKVSTGCKHCYAERIFKRPYPGRDFTDVRCHPERLDQPLRWKKPRMVFVNSMSDLFHERVPFEFIADVFHTMTGECSYEAPPRHTYQILTKRPGRMLEFFDWVRNCGPDPIQAYALRTLWFHDKPAPYVWLGVSVENQETADERIPLLLETPAAVRFLSCEPLLGPIDLINLGCEWTAERGRNHVDWVIVGGESGPKARPMDLGWAQTIVNDCSTYGVPCFVKQLGGWPDKRGDIDAFPPGLQVREMPRGADK